jgi:hypothetical protein
LKQLTLNAIFMVRNFLLGLSLLLSGASGFTAGFAPPQRLRPLSLIRHAADSSSRSLSSRSSSAEEARAAFKRYDELSMRLDDGALSDTQLMAILDELDVLEAQGLWDYHEDEPLPADVGTDEKGRWADANELAAPRSPNAAEKEAEEEAAVPVKETSPAQAARDAALFEKALR